MKKTIVCSLLTCLALAAMADSDYDKAKQLFGQKEYAKALPFFEETVIAHPDWYPAVYFKGRCNYHLKDYKKALIDFNDALTMEVPSNQIAVLKYYIAKSYMGMADYDKAIATFDDIISHTPKSRHYDIHTNRATCQMKIAQKLERSNPSKARSWFAKSSESFGSAFISETRSAKQKKDAGFQKAWTQFRAATLANDVAGLKKAQNYCSEVIKLDSKEERAHELMISLDFRIIGKSTGDARTAQYRKAVTHLDAYLKNWPDNVEMLDKKGKALQGAKRYKEALTVFEKLTAKKPNDGGAWFSLGSCQMAAKQYTKAIGSLEKAKARGERKNQNLYTYIAYSHVQQKNDCYDNDIPLYKKAVAVLEDGLKAVPGDQLIQKDLNDKKNILGTIEGNLATDNGNHQSAITNITELNKSIAANTQTMIKNKDLYLQQPTDELKAAIDEGEKTIKADNETLAKEYKVLAGYIREANKCGGASTFPKLNEMKQLQAQKSK